MKTHYYTTIIMNQNPQVKPDVVWFNSACNLAAAMNPTMGFKRVTCLRCLMALEKAIVNRKDYVSGKTRRNTSKF